jgi:hypothetical protein
MSRIAERLQNQSPFLCRCIYTRRQCRITDRRIGQSNGRLGVDFHIADIGQGSNCRVRDGWYGLLMIRRTLNLFRYEALVIFPDDASQIQSVSQAQQHLHFSAPLHTSIEFCATVLQTTDSAPRSTCHVSRIQNGYPRVQIPQLPVRHDILLAQRVRPHVLHRLNMGCQLWSLKRPSKFDRYMRAAVA